MGRVAYMRLTSNTNDYNRFYNVCCTRRCVALVIICMLVSYYVFTPAFLLVTHWSDYHHRTKIDTTTSTIQIDEFDNSPSTSTTIISTRSAETTEVTQFSTNIYFNIEANQDAPLPTPYSTNISKYQAQLREYLTNATKKVSNL